MVSACSDLGLGCAEVGVQQPEREQPGSGGRVATGMSLAGTCWASALDPLFQRGFVTAQCAGRDLPGVLAGFGIPSAGGARSQEPWAGPTVGCVAPTAPPEGPAWGLSSSPEPSPCFLLFLLTLGRAPSCLARVWGLFAPAVLQTRP